MVTLRVARCVYPSSIVAAFVLIGSFGSACSDERVRIQSELLKLPQVSEAEVRDMSEEDLGSPEYVATVLLSGGRSLTISGVRAAAFESASSLVVDEADGWLPRCLFEGTSGAMLGIDVVQPVGSAFLPGRIRNLPELVSRYDEVVAALRALPHEEESAKPMTLDGEVLRCFAASPR
jgi:hypothetical protein